MSALSEDLSRMALEMGGDLYGVADAEGFLNPDYQGNRPQEVMPLVRSVAIVGVALPRGAMDALPKGRAEYTNTLMAATATLRVITFRMARHIEKAGYLASIAPAEGSEFGYWYADRQTLKADISVKYAAYLAGLGRYGLNHLLVTEEYGPRVRFMAILTDAPLGTGVVKGDLVDKRCQGCGKCIAVCPASAIDENGIMHREKCAQYMFHELGGLRCGMCLKICPL